MNATILNRTILAAVIGSVLGFGSGAPASALAQDLAAKEQQASDEDESERSRARKNREQREARAAQAEADRTNAEANRAAAADENRGRAEADARHRENEQRQAEQAQRNREAERGARSDARQEEYRQQQAQQARQAEQADRNAAQAREQRDQSVEQAREQRDRSVEQAREQSERDLEQAREQRERQGREQQERSRERQERYTPVPQPRQDGDEVDETVRNQDGNRRGDWGNDVERRRRIDEQRNQAQRYQRAQQIAQDRARRDAINLQNQHRTSQYRYHQDYYSRVQQFNQRYDWQRYDYNNDPYFYAAPSYRYQRDGRYYNVNRYAAETLQQAVHYGYAEGIRAGRADRYDGWRYSYRDSFAYMHASYGYRGMYVSQFDYNYYFRQGFKRGFEDGYYGRRRYGRQYNGSDALLGTVLSVILNLQQYRY